MNGALKANGASKGNEASATNTASSDGPDRRWWKEAIIYQIYPASFLDTDGDGFGNVNGITSKLDYLRDLGADILWINPIYKSPQRDMGYDISDYRDIHPPYGTMEDVDRLIAEVKKRDMKIIMDLVVNHTSNQHPWFIESASSKDNPKRNWYIWKKPKYDADGNRQPPNNWSSLIKHTDSGWTYHPETDEYYLSLFSAFQPDLNWEVEEVRKEVHSILRFWLDKGVSGFRMDVINFISKDPKFPDADITDPNKEYQIGKQHFATGPRLMEYLHDMKRSVLSEYESVTVGEAPFISKEEERLAIIRAEGGALNMIFTFEMIELDMDPQVGRFSHRAWNAHDLRDAMTMSYRMIERNGWHTLFCENHDQPRSVSRFCDDSDEHRVASTKLLCTMQITLPGTLYLYQGEELGMRNIPKSWGPEEYKDIESQVWWEQVCEKHPEGSPERDEAKRLLRLKARDNARTPFPWDSTSNGGFSPAGVKTWMRVHEDYPIVNAEAQLAAGRANNRSMLVSPYRFWQRSIDVRKRQSDLFVYGSFETVQDTPSNIFAYRRKMDDQEAITILNFSKHETDFTLPADVEVKLWVLGSYDSLSTEKPKTGVIHLLPWESLLGIVQGDARQLQD
ncbi:alpha-glucosidase (maltase) [Fusarium heterosporum]|uniref:Alpha-glucosidase (Maltase) n=1 Tax=Fusarium heterosporum TaxID=42747 RepID=A0A8H5TFG2_FUSHE|nr:alpha-glucosidase (maltase) [Fusarium heterosporum]